MSQVKVLQEADFDDFITIVANAYPSFTLTSEEDRQRMRNRFKARSEDPVSHLYGLYRKDQLLGGMILFDFTMKLLSTKIRAGGVGLVAVDILHKKEKVAKDMITYFLQHYRERGATMALLYPFRPDFYRKMGFGYGSKMSQYRVRPAALPRGKTKEHITLLCGNDKYLLRDCYNRRLEATNGLVEKSDFELDGLFNNKETRIVAYKRDGNVLGYIAFSFKSAKPDSFLANDIHIREFMYESSEVLSELLTFLHDQADQINRIVFNTQDDYFHFLPLDPRNGSDNVLPHVYHESNTQGVGIMYRVIDTPGIFAALGEHNFGNQHCTLKLSIDDSFFKANDGSTIVHFEHGKAEVRPAQDYEVEVALDVASFSSLITGAVDFKSLYRYGLADISDSRYVDAINKLFMTEEKPICTTPF